MGGRHFKGGLIAVAFGGGLLVSMICPPQFMIAVLAVAMVLMGIAYIKC